MAYPTEQKLYTTDDILSLPEGVRAELIDGRIYYQDLPSQSHARITFRLSQLIDTYIQQSGSPCELYVAPFPVLLSGDGLNYAEPDVFVVSGPEKVGEHGCNGAPDLVIEVVSPGTRNVDYGAKLVKYQSAGVWEYWIIDAPHDSIQVYSFENGSLDKYTFRDSVPVGIFSGCLTIDFKVFQRYL